MSSSPPKRILVTLATGKQGGHVVRSLARRNESKPDGQQPYEILALTRNAESSAAKSLSALPGVHLLVSEYDPATVFAKATEGGKPLYGVFSVQTFMVKQPNGMKGVDGERWQGKAVADEAAKAGVQHFVYTSVDFGGLDKTDIPHFESKRDIENYIHQKHPSMPTTILRPTAFMDNLSTKDDMMSKIGNTVFTHGYKKPLQLIACSDIGEVAAKAFDAKEAYVGQTISLAGDTATPQQVIDAFQQGKGKPLSTTYGFLAKGVFLVSKEMSTMFRFFDAHGYTADIEALRKTHPQLKTLRQWVETEA